MADSFKVELQGVDELKRALSNVGANIRKKAVRGALREAGKVIQAAARQSAPVLQEQKAGRRPGTIKRRITVRNSKFARQQGNEGVFVGVRPLTKAQIRKFKSTAAAGGRAWSGKDNPNDPYYWWWVEFGHRIVPRRGGQSGGGMTRFPVRMKSGNVHMRARRWSASSLTGRRRLSVGSVAPRPFLGPASKSAGPQAVEAFMRSVVPQINKFNQKAGGG